MITSRCPASRQPAFRILARYCQIAWLAIVVSIGCHGESDPATVTGKIMFDGVPLTSGQVIAVTDTGNMARADIKGDGSFELFCSQTNPGADPCKYRVAVLAYEGDDVDLKSNPEAPRQLLVPQRYTEPHTSGLEFKVTTGENKEIVLKLTSSR